MCTTTGSDLARKTVKKLIPARLIRRLQLSIYNASIMFDEFAGKFDN